MILLHYDGGAFDPTAEGDEEEAVHLQILNNLGLMPEWSCRGSKNTVRLNLPKGEGMNTLLAMLLAAIAALIAAGLGTFLPDAAREGLNNYLLTPMFEAFLGIVNTMAGIIIFLAVSSAVFGIGNTSALSRIGKVMFPRYLITVFISSIITVLIALSFCPLRMSSAVMGDSQLGKISNMIFDILPKNLVRPFLDGNMMQVIVMAVFTGVILLVMGERSSRITALIENLGSVTQYMMEIICRLIPLFVFTSLLSQI